ncbi:MAG TPA: hypothetical protein VK465_16885 [Fibrobacteria bacterium]|nr:hypothetical protein [Fibrobacteria bacterium]
MRGTTLPVTMAMPGTMRPEEKTMKAEVAMSTTGSGRGGSTVTASIGTSATRLTSVKTLRWPKRSERRPTQRREKKGVNYHS